MGIVARNEDSDFSPTWKWSDDEELAGTHVEFRKAAVDDGDRVIWVVDSDEHGPVSVWLEPAVLVQKVRGELARRKAERGSARLDLGERVRINPGAKRPSKRTAGQTVWPFQLVEFEHGIPEPTAEELLLSGESASDDDEEDALDDALESNVPPIPEADDVPF